MHHVSHLHLRLCHQTQHLREVPDVLLLLHEEVSQALLQSNRRLSLHFLPDLCQAVLQLLLMLLHSKPDVHQMLFHENQV